MLERVRAALQELNVPSVIAQRRDRASLGLSDDRFDELGEARAGAADRAVKITRLVERGNDGRRQREADRAALHVLGIVRRSGHSGSGSIG